MIANDIRAGIVIVQDYRLVFANPAFHELLGYGPGELDNTLIEESIVPEDYPIVRQRFEQHISGQNPPGVYEFSMLKKGGMERVQIEMRASLSKYDGRSAVIGTIVNLTEQNLAQMALRESENRFRQMAENAPVVIWMSDVEAKAIYFNHALLDYSGHSEKQLLGEGWTMIIHADDLERVQSVYGTAFQARQPFEMEFRIRGADGEYHWFIGQGVPRFDPGGRFSGYIGTCADIHDRKLAEQSLRESEKKYRMLLESQWDGVFVAQDYQFMFANIALPRMLGYTHEEFLGLPFQAVVAPEFLELWMRRYKQRIGNGPEPQGNYEIQLLRKGGASNIWIELQAHRIEYGGRRAVLGVVRDITERKQAEITIMELNESLEQRVNERTAELSIANAKLERARIAAASASEAKSDFVSRMSHELRTPLHAILGFSQLLEESLSHATPEEKKSVQQIYHSGQHLLTLINEVLDLSRIEAGNLGLVLENIDLNDGTGKECLEQIQVQAEKNNITLHFKADASPAVVYADRIRLKQVLLNLLSNAVKYNRPQGSVTLEFHAPVQERVRVTVTDTGMGIARDQQDRIFQPFTRIHRHDSGIEGTGIGLTITRRLVEGMGGTIGFVSEAGTGTTFWFELRAGRETPRVKPLTMIAVEKTAATSAPPATHGKVLYIEDTSANVQLMRMIVKRMPGVELLDSNTAELGIALALKQRPDLILMDIDLPGMDGIEALLVLRQKKKTRDIPVIAVSAAVMAHDLERIQQAGFDAILSKPFNIQSVPALLLKHLGSSKTDLH